VKGKKHRDDELKEGRPFMMEKFPFLQNEVFGNTVLSYLLTFAVFLVGVCFLLLLEKIVLNRLKVWAQSTEWKADDIALAIINKNIIPLLYLGAFYFATHQLVLSERAEKMVTSFCVVVLTIQVTRLILSIVFLALGKAGIKGGVAEVGATKTSQSIFTIIKIVAWGLSIVFILDNLGFNISAVVAGLGIGGVAVAFAAQAILGDLFNYFVIFFDKPFEQGDFIIIGDYLGVIEHVGIKTTRIRSLGGEQLVFSNTDLTSSRVRNYKRMEKRRVLFKMGVIYQTKMEQMKKIPGIVREVIEGIDKTVFDRAHFQGFGDFSLDIEVVYYVLSSDYNIYMDIQEKINLGIMGAFEKEGIEFAYPTQTLYMTKN